ncbi:MAG TPA: hypothetical protein VFY39_16255 [Gammaproteobacteria bacterium]|nr:hypothetical protein [Gammaproteobacteria bacterium]
MYGRLHKSGAMSNPLVQALSLFVLGAVLIGAVLMGAVILSFLLAAAAVGAAVIAVRIWWFGRKLRHAAERRDRLHGPDHSSHGRLIDADYTIVAEREARMRHWRRRD